MRTGMLALASGLLSLIWLPVLPSVGWQWGLLFFGLLCLMFRRWRAGLFLLGLGWACLSAQAALDERLSAHLDGRTLWLEGQVVGLPAQGAQAVRFELADARSRRETLPARLQLTWHGGPPLRSGERWRLAVTLRQPGGLLNPHGPDPQAHLLARRIGASGSVKAGERLAPAAWAWRDSLRQRLAGVDAYGREGALAALVLGDGGGLSAEDWQALQATGTVHLMVISGQHVGLLAGLIYALVAGLARIGCWPRRLPWLPWACGLAFAAALGYGLLAGFQVPVQRACIMLAVVLLWRLRFRHLSFGWPLLLALVGVLLVEPLASLLPGFWLSFAAVAVLIFSFSGRLGAWHRWRAWTRAQWLIAVGLLPVLLGWGLPVSLTAPLANLLAVPWVSVIVVPLALGGTLLLPLPWIGETLLWLAGGALAGLFAVLDWLAAWQPAWLPAAPPWWGLALIVLGALLILLPTGLPMRVLGVPLLALAGLLAPQRVPFGEVEVWQLDVGQGQAFILRTSAHVMLYDAGPALADSDLGERVVLPTLRKLGIDRLDLMLLSHADSDHAGGARAIRRGLPVARVIAGDPAALHAGLHASACSSGERWEWEGAHFSLWQWEGASGSNQGSCVLRVEAGGESLLLTGDIDARAEAAWLHSPMAGPVDWLQAPHHGSRSSSSATFLALTAPTGILLSRGRYNHFGHPHPQVLARYAALGSVVYDSAVLGAVRLRLGRFARPQAQREQRRFWREPT
ncbi:DNA internalization-related competence protein ComEC/Rec2 [Pseudomonas sp. SDI]|uniref:DNA internalization-related competence protein ComEC/Rec2 n=1 Tax=Pseudomonas sp. SDI TaxID=2170734 RepID=UPI000DE61032|nr:DNA internalization-related competence protein ComEC/Rec2 [Pseudomonas sp. SDI]PWB35920.1 DNA internalization-related competence protein ComEC/Rec2 [Pseudomonas sp. SDI]